MSLATTCPQCKTSFKVVPDQLKLRRGLVRCGVCQHVFSGIDSLRYVDERPVAPAPPPVDEDEAFDAAHESTLGHDGEPPDTEFFEPATTTGADARDGAFAAPPDEGPEADPDGAFDASGRLVEAPARADPGDDEAEFERTGAIEAFDTGYAPPPEVAAADDPAAPPGHEPDDGRPPDESLGGASPDDAEVEHYDITAARGWPHEDADLLDVAAGPSDDPSGAGDGAMAPATADAAAPPEDFATGDAAGHAGGDTTGTNAAGGLAAGGMVAGGLAAGSQAAGGRAAGSSSAGGVAGAAASTAAGAEAEQDAIDFFAPQRRVRGFSSRSAPLQWLAACVLVAALLLQVLIGARHWLAARAPDLEPLLAAAAGVVGLTVDPPRELDALTIESFELQASGVDKLFALVAHLRNRADHVVHWPAMELALTDSAGTLVARKVLLPSDYLGAGTKSPLPAGIGPGAEVPVRVALEAPGLSPSGYTVNIFYP